MQMIDLCDTNIISELARPNQGVMDWASHISVFYVSVITVDEIYFGLAHRPNLRIESWMRHFFRHRCYVLPITEEIAAYAGKLRGELSLQGQVRSQADMLIAATVWKHQLRLITRNEKDFIGCHINVFNPFQ